MAIWVFMVAFKNIKEISVNKTWSRRYQAPLKSNKNAAIKFSLQNVSLEVPLSGMLIITRSESQIMLKSLIRSNIYWTISTCFKLNFKFLFQCMDIIFHDSILLITNYFNEAMVIFFFLSDWDFCFLNN